MCGQNLYIHLHLAIDLLVKLFHLAAPVPMQRGRVVLGLADYTPVWQSVFHGVHVKPQLPPNIYDNIASIQHMLEYSETV